MGFQVKEVLKRICNNNGWSYAIFWRIDCSNPMMLMPEDAYYEPLRHSVILDSSSITKRDWNGLPESACLIQVKREDDRIALLIEKSHQVHIVGEGIIGRVASSGNHQWIFHDTSCGEQCGIGPVGYQTVFQDNAELQHQFSAGIKTIATISVAPHGVVQFGSTQKIMENLEVVENIKRSFQQLENVPGPFLCGSMQRTLNHTISNSATCQTFGSVVSSGNFYSDHANIKSLSDDGSKVQMAKPSQLSSPSILWSHHRSTQPCDLDVPVNSNPHITGDSMALFTRNPSFHITNQCQTAGTDAQMILSTPDMRSSQILLQSNSNSTNGNRISVTSRPNNSLISDFSTLPSLEQQLLSGMEIQGFQNIFHSNSPSLAPYRTTLTNLKGECILNPSFKTSGTLGIITHPTTLDMKNDLYVQPSSSAGHVIGHEQSARKSSTFPYDLDHIKQSTNFDMFLGADGQTCFRDANVKDVQRSLPDSIPGSINSVKENQGSVAVCDGKQKSLSVPMQLSQIDELFNRSGLDFNDNHQQACWDDVMLPDWSNLSTGVSELDTVSMIGLEKGYISEIGSDHLLDAVVANVSSDTNKNLNDLLSKSTSALTGTSSGSLYNSPDHFSGLSCVGENVDNFLPGNGERTAWGSQKEKLSRSQISSWVEQSQNINTENAVFGQSKSVKEPPKVTRKRARPGESTRPRPKDRQQIQDRVKELREIVPNGEKCSIDALLDRTIRHMLFLQSVTKHADKLKQAGEPKMIGKESYLVLKDALEGAAGATWAFEYGGQSMVCPILVEDLNPPGQMLVEMLCEERGFFLEIADKIRGFGLTILKGMMEARDEKIWARFVVEAKKDVTRLDISLSLVQLLEQASKNSGSPCSQSAKVIESGGPGISSYQQSPMPLPFSLAERLQ